MSVLTPAQVYQLARGAGFTPTVATLMVAIAGAESGWRTDAKGDVGLQNATWGPSIGLWQIRSLKAETGKGTTRDASRLTDPAFNARSAYAIYKGQGLSAWSVYTSGSYRRFTGQASAASGQTAGPLPTTAGGSTAALPGGLLNQWNWPGAIAGALGDAAGASLWAQIQPFLVTAGFVTAGLALVIIGTTVTAWPTVKGGVSGVTALTPLKAVTS